MRRPPKSCRQRKGDVEAHVAEEEAEEGDAVEAAGQGLLASARSPCDGQVEVALTRRDKIKHPV
jgi:hypothetical protein